jgi:NADH-quinone oxidoreductase subunit A
MLDALGAALVVLVGTAAAVVVARWLRDVTDPAALTVPERVPFAGGHPPDVHAWSRFHARYYTMAILFLAFDMEMVFMYPWAVVYVREGLTALIEMLMFIVILLVGVLYAWRERALEWQ